MSIKGWIGLTIGGFLIIILQLLFPDLVTSSIIKLLSDDTTSRFIGLKPTLEAFLILWIIGGYVSFLTGIVGTFVSFRRR